MSDRIIRSFPPVADAYATRLILGSMPGKRSLTEQQYYAHPQNAFWRIAGQCLGFSPDLQYAERCQSLRAAGAALWDVLAACERPSSLDADIVEDSIVANDFARFLAEDTRITAVYFNGAKAETSFRRHVLPTLSNAQSAITLQRLPSTSPAHASLRYADKLAAWRVV
ncbi:MAG TPA: DNA-deoxyinosine glycosylase, partial [Gammaproteobacteria bacterium]|nr:DNA-deoxyinosine glycosylase [Gammaproteobacteria bacterium]